MQFCDNVVTISELSIATNINYLCSSYLVYGERKHRQTLKMFVCRIVDVFKQTDFQTHFHVAHGLFLSYFVFFCRFIISVLYVDLVTDATYMW